MTLLAAIFAAAAATAVWYGSAAARRRNVGVLCWLYWGASLMWLVDAVIGYVEEGAAFFTPEPAQMLNDLYLGLSVIALGLVIWIIVLLVKDPDGVIRDRLRAKK